jgi:hypothetical protein
MINDGGWWGHALGVALLLMRWYCSFPIQSISDMSMFMLSVWSNIQAEIINKTKKKTSISYLDIFSLYNHIYPIYFYPGSLCQDQKCLPICCLPADTGYAPAWPWWWWRRRQSRFRRQSAQTHLALWECQLWSLDFKVIDDIVTYRNVHHNPCHISFTFMNSIA